MSSVIVVRFDDMMLSELSRCVVKHRWCVLDGRSARTLVKRVLAARPALLLVQVSGVAETALTLIERVSRHWNPLAVVAIASEPSPSTEQALRRAGATAYVGPGATVEALERLLVQVAPSCLDPLSERDEIEMDEAGHGSANGTNGLVNRRIGGELEIKLPGTVRRPGMRAGE